MKKMFLQIKEWLASLSFKTGVVVIGCCILCYLLSFLQGLLPISLAWKGVLWVVFFGMAKTLQYTGILILGKEGWRKLRGYFGQRKKEIEI